MTPRGNWNIMPRIDYMPSEKNTLWVSFFSGHYYANNQGTGDFNLASLAYANHGNNNQVQVADTAILSPHMVSDTRFQYFRNLNENNGNNAIPVIIVAGAFNGGGSPVGNSGAISTNLS